MTSQPDRQIIHQLIDLRLSGSGRVEALPASAEPHAPARVEPADWSPPTDDMLAQWRASGFLVVVEAQPPGDQQVDDLLRVRLYEPFPGLRAILRSTVREIVRKKRLLGYAGLGRRLGDTDDDDQDADADD